MGRVLDDCDNSLEFFGCDLTGTAKSLVFVAINRPHCSVPLVEVDISLLADQVGVSSADTLDSGQGVHDLLFSIDVGVQQSQDELEVRLLATDESCARTLAFIRLFMMSSVARCGQTRSALRRQRESAERQNESNTYT